MISLYKFLEGCVKAVSIAYLVLLLVPGLSSILNVDTTATSSHVAFVIAAITLILPKVKEMAIPALAARALRERLKAQQRANDKAA